MKVKPKKHGHPALNTICPDCGRMFSEQRGHDCDDNKYY